jgi:hypothetical protein
MSDEIIQNAARQMGKILAHLGRQKLTGHQRLELLSLVADGLEQGSSESDPRGTWLNLPMSRVDEESGYTQEPDRMLAISWTRGEFLEIVSMPVGQEMPDVMETPLLVLERAPDLFHVRSYTRDGESFDVYDFKDSPPDEMPE